MRIARVVALVVSALLVAGVVVSLRLRWLPTGVRGEWEWSRVPFPPFVGDVVLALMGLLAFAGYAALGRHALEERADGTGPSRIREGLWVGSLVVAGFLGQLAIMAGAPTGFGASKCVVLANPGSTGYFDFARFRMEDPWAFWKDYPRWIRDQDALHIGTHPPGLLLASRGLLALTRAYPRSAGWVDSVSPRSVAEGFRTLVAPMPGADRAAIILMAIGTMIACCATVVPLYGLARSRSSASWAWSSACLWPLAPSAVMFCPLADTAYPLIATSALALSTRRGGWSACLAGVILGVGMQFTLAFLPVGLAVAIVIALGEGDTRAKGSSIVLTGVGFLGFTGLIWAISGANPWSIWMTNAANHSRFYAEYHRSYRAWAVANAIETAVAIGLASVVWMVIGARCTPRSMWAGAIVVALLNLSGKNLGEVARLWLPFFPGLLVVAASGFQRLRAGPWTLAGVVTLVGIETLALQATIQVVYPF